MGCTWSDEQQEIFSTLEPDKEEIDPVEEHLHIKAWRDPATRTRMVGTEGESAGSTQEGGSATMTSKVLSSAKEAAISLLKGTTAQKEPVPTPGIPNMQEDSEGPASPPEDAAQRGEEGNAGRVKQEAARTLDAEARVADAEAREEKLRAMRVEVERSQVEEKKRALRGIDPSCWEKLAEQGYFQQAEDQLKSAAELECNENGESERYARLVYAVGALYDFRSNRDVTGQEQALSIVSARYCEEAAKVLREVTQKQGDACSREVTSLLAAVLLMRGRSLCNSALDGDVPDMSVEEQFEKAQRDLDEATALRETGSMLQGEGLAESVTAVGYLWYCKAGWVVNQKGYGTSRFKGDKETPGPEQLAVMYKRALENYTRGLALYVETVGAEHTDSVRMMCNIALTYNTWSRALDEPELRRERMVQSEETYKNVLEIQERVYGSRHPRTLRVKQDLKDVQQRRAVLDGEAPPPPEAPLDDAERRKEADELMEQFLKERREERQAERVVDRPAAAVPGAEGWASIVDHTKAVPGDSQEG